MSSSSVIPVHVGIVDFTGQVAMQEIASLCGALNAQVSGEFLNIWKARASVGPYNSAQDRMWQVQIKKKLDVPGALGYHTTRLGQPISYVMYTRDYGTTVGHEVLEMLADPSGNRMHGGRLPWGMEGRYKDFGLKTKNSHVSYLVEVCDPPEAFSYEMGEVALTDFITPDWYDSNYVEGTRYSWAGGCKYPREVADGGYVSFCTPDDTWWQVFNTRGHLQISNLGKFDRNEFGSLRVFTDLQARTFREA